MYFPQSRTLSAAAPVTTYKPATSRGARRSASTPLQNGKKKLSVQFSAGAFHTPFPALHTMQITPREGPRKPPAPSLPPKYRKNGASVFQRHIRTVFRQFLPGNWETSDFLRANIRGFASKVRRFVAKKSDVFGAFPPFFRPFFAVFCRFQRQKCPETMVNDYSDLHYFDIHALQNAIILPFFRAGRDAGHCQNF